MGFIKDPTVRVATREDIRAIAAPLWVLLGSRAKGMDFDIMLGGALAIVANLAYCAITDEERQNHTRATLVPCELYQRLLVSPAVDLEEALASRDFPGATIVPTRFFVAVVVQASDLILVGIRGTQFAYDWALNAWALKREVDDGLYFHAGFYREAEKLGVLLKREISRRYVAAARDGRPTPTLYVAGHSLGGAIAGIINRMGDLPAPAGCYVFGAARSCNDRYLGTPRGLYAVRRPTDIVPRVPPRFLNFADYAEERHTDGAPYEAEDSAGLLTFAGWLRKLALKSFVENHSMELYISEVVAEARRDPHIAEIWDEADWLRESWPFP